MKKSLILLLSIGFLSGCNLNSSDTFLENDNIASIPLAVGNEWTFTKSEDILSKNNQPILSESKLSVLSDTVIDGITWYFLKSDDFHLDNLLGGYYHNQANGIYFSNPTKEDTTSLVDNSFLRLHNPDKQIGPRTIETQNSIGSVEFHDIDFDQESNLSKLNYSFSYYQLIIDEKVYSLKPEKFELDISQKNGFEYVETGAYSQFGTTGDDPRLSLVIRISYSLIEFSNVQS